MKIEHTHTSGIVCPYCGHEQREPWEAFPVARSHDENDVQCDNCDKEFNAVMECEVMYSTTKKDTP